MDNKKLMIIAAGIVVLAIVVLAAAFVVLNNGNENASATPTPAPQATTEPGSGASTSTPSSMANQGPTATPTPGPTGPIVIQAQAQANSTGICFVSIFLNKGASPIDTGSMKMNIECEGQTFASVWTPKQSDWAGADGDTLLESNEVIATQINTKALGIPQGKVFKIKILQDSAVLQETSVTPT